MSQTRFFAFLRAINVGGHTVKMTELVKPFQALGLAKVETFIASGNVIFWADTPPNTASDLEHTIETALQHALGYAVTTFLRTDAELSAIHQHRPFLDVNPTSEKTTLYVACLKSNATDAMRQKLSEYENEQDSFQLHNRELYWRCRMPSHLSKFSGAVFERAFGTPATFRNINTLQRLAKKYLPA